MFYLYLTNTLAIALSLGLLTPWAIIRTKAYRASCTSLYLVIEQQLDNFVSTQQAQAAAVGEEVGEMFDLDLGI